MKQPDWLAYASCGAVVILGLAAGAAAVLAIALVLLVAGSVDAHTPKAVLECPGGLTVDLTRYSTGSDNHVLVRLDGDKLADQHFKGGEFHFHADTDPTVAHVARVEVWAQDDPDGRRGWTVDIDLSAEACEEPSPTPEPSSTPGPTPHPTPRPTPPATDTAP